MDWSHENFIVARHIHPSLRSSEFCFSDFSDQLFDNFPDLDKLNFVVIQKRALEDEALSFFKYLTRFSQAVLFRLSLGTLSFEHARIVLLFWFSRGCVGVSPGHH